MQIHRADGYCDEASGEKKSILNTSSIYRFCPSEHRLGCKCVQIWLVALFVEVLHSIGEQEKDGRGEKFSPLRKQRVASDGNQPRQSLDIPGLLSPTEWRSSQIISGR